MKINVVCFGRRWLLDVARELSKQGFDVIFYTAIPKKRAAKFGLKMENCSSLFWLLIPLFLVNKFLKINSKQANRVFDFLVSKIMRKSDVYISDVTIDTYRSFKQAKKNKSIVLVESGCTHILNQKEVLNEWYLSKGVKNKFEEFEVKTELDICKDADIVVAPSLIVKKTFLDNGYPEHKIFFNPYGVDLNEFYPIANTKKEFDIIITGTWCYRKGCDLLLDICETMSLTLLHVGPIGDLEFPDSKKMKHIGSVEQGKLITYYSKAKIFVLPSREEGFGLVVTQAIACGLPVVCSEFVGAKDVKEIQGFNLWIFEMENYTLDELKNEILKALIFFETKDVTSLNLFKISWEINGERYNRFLNQYVSI